MCLVVGPGEAPCGNCGSCSPQSPESYDPEKGSGSDATLNTDNT